MKKLSRHQIILKLGELRKPYIKAIAKAMFGYKSPLIDFIKKGK